MVDTKKIEEYILTKDRKDFLKNQLPGTHSHHFFTICEALSTQGKLTKP